MSNDHDKSRKNDLTRLEDMAKFEHDLTDQTEHFLQNLPEIPQEAELTLNSENSPLGSTPLLETEKSEDPFLTTDLPKFDKTDFSLPAVSTPDASPLKNLSPSAQEVLQKYENQKMATFERLKNLTQLFHKPQTDELTSLSFPNPSSDLSETRVENSSLDTLLTEPQPFLEQDLLNESQLETTPLEESSNIVDSPVDKSLDNLDEIKAPLEEMKEELELAALDTQAFTECYPAFHLIVKLNSTEDSLKEELLDDLKPCGLDEAIKQSLISQLQRGEMLIPRLSEYSVIMLLQKWRHHPLSFSLNLVQEEASESLLAQVSAQMQPRLSQSSQFKKAETMQQSEQVLVTTLPSLEGHHIKEYLGLIHEHLLIPTDEMRFQKQDHVEEFYDQLLTQLKMKAQSKQANAILGLNYHLSPLKEAPELGQSFYKLSATGNLAQVIRQ
jgi:hypothetical protein